MVDVPKGHQKQSPRIEIYVAMHKESWVPADPMYRPMRVGAALYGNDFGYLRDDEGDNISTSNPRYSELTALYWAWKHSDADYVGLCHYRRQFHGTGERHTLTSQEASAALRTKNIVAPKPQHYYIETVATHYAHTHSYEHLDILRQVVREKSPESSAALEVCLNRRMMRICNMCIMSKDLLNDYCSWLFPLLSEIETHIDFEGMTPFQQRTMGRLSEILFNTWLTAKGIEPHEIAIEHIDRVHWAKKATRFLLAKFAGRKYTDSF